MPVVTITLLEGYDAATRARLGTALTNAVAGVLAHEIGHVENRDATIGALRAAGFATVRLFGDFDRRPVAAGDTPEPLAEKARSVASALEFLFQRLAALKRAHMSVSGGLFSHL